MAIKSSFFDNETYSAADVNKIIARIVARGVSAEGTQFVNGTAYNLNSVNDFTKAYVSQGVAYQDDTALKVALIEDSYVVQKGTCFFGNGTVTEVTASEAVTVTEGEDNYIYMVSDMANNNNHIAVSSVCPNYVNDINIVPLAKVDADGIITDMRFYARGKLPGYQNADNGAKIIPVTVNTANCTNGYVDVDLHTTHLSMIAFCNNLISKNRAVSGIGVIDGDNMTCVNAGYIWISESGVPYRATTLIIDDHLGIARAEYLSGTNWRLHLIGNSGGTPSIYKSPWTFDLYIA